MFFSTKQKNVHGLQKIDVKPVEGGREKTISCIIIFRKFKTSQKASQENNFQAVIMLLTFVIHEHAKMRRMYKSKCMACYGVLSAKLLFSQSALIFNKADFILYEVSSLFSRLLLALNYM
jgi:hypothetical protein